MVHPGAGSVKICRQAIRVQKLGKRTVVLSEASVAVAVAPALLATTQAAPTTPSDPIEIVFADAVVRVREGANAALLRTIFQGLRA
jgi:transposase